MLAGMGSGAWKSPDHLPPLPEGATRFEPRLTDDQRETGFARWQRASSASARASPGSRATAVRARSSAGPACPR